MTSSPARRLHIVLGDQLDPELSALADLDPGRDVVWMAESDEEIGRIRSHRLRIALFLSAMRHHRDVLREQGITVRYHELGATPGEDRAASFADLLAADLESIAPDAVVLTRPGDHRVLEELRGAARDARVPLELREDDRFLCELSEFDEWAEGRKRWVLETFYRSMRRRTGVLMVDGEPAGDRWNFDEMNREAFPDEGPGEIPERPSWSPDEVDEAVLELVAGRYGEHPGRLESFRVWPRTPEQATEALDFFARELLPDFGTHQDAMWTDRPLLRHSMLSFPLNVGLLRPRACLDAAVAAWSEGAAPLNSVEGFVRQILGWREFVRGIYWRLMPEYADRNALQADQPLPDFYWTGDTPMRCVAESMRGVLEYGYAHHIQRLMVLGLYAQLYGVDPHEFHEWHLAMYVDAVDWVSLPNALGMSQFGDGGVMGTKPYCASGNYIDRMSNYCSSCGFDPGEATGEDACPFTTLYWDFLARHEDGLRSNHRMGFQYSNLDRKRGEGLDAIRERARELRGVQS